MRVGKIAFFHKNINKCLKKGANSTNIIKVNEMQQIKCFKTVLLSHLKTLQSLYTCLCSVNDG